MSGYKIQHSDTSFRKIRVQKEVMQLYLYVTVNNIA